MEAILPTSQPSICYHQLTLDQQGGESENGKGGWKSQALTVYLCWQEGVGGEDIGLQQWEKRKVRVGISRWTSAALPRGHAHTAVIFLACPFLFY